MTAVLREVDTEKEKKGIRRIASLDFQRGLAIWLMVFLHVFNHIWDYANVTVDDLFNNLNFGLSLVMVLMAFFGGFAGYFILISSVVNSLATTKSALKGINPNQLLVKRVLTGIGILVAGRLTEMFGYYGYFGRVFWSGEAILSASTWTNPIYTSFLWRRIFMMEALQIIGWCQIITGIVTYFLVRKNGVEKFLRNIIIYAVFAVAILVASPFMWNWLDNLAWSNIPSIDLIRGWGVEATDVSYHYSWPSEILQSVNPSFLT